MTWPTHQAGALIAALGLQLPLTALGASIFGAILPDVIDQTVSRAGLSKKGRQKIFNRIHRGHSHWFGWWLIIFLILLCYPLPPVMRDILAGIALGALSHITLDFLTPRGVPLIPFRSGFNVAIPLCSTGKIGEYIFLFFLILLGLSSLFVLSPIPGGVIAKWKAFL